jgi:membrane fusion protein YbhG
MKKILIVIAGALLALVGYGLYNKNHVVVAKDYLALYGNVDIRDVTLGFRVSGRVAQMRREEGDSVKQGDVLAVLDTDYFLDDVALAQAELDEAKAIATHAVQAYSRLAKLLKTGAAAQAKYDELQAQKVATKARKVRATTKLKLLRTRLADTKLRAPNDGVILTRVLEPGSVVALGGPVYVLALNRPVWVRAYIDEPLLGQVYPGQLATVFTDNGGQYQGQVGFISPQAEFTPKTVETTQLRTKLVYRLRVIVDNADKGLRQGMPVTVKLHLRQKVAEDVG